MRPKTPIHSAAEAAARRHGVVSSRQLERLGYSRRRISREVAAGRLHRLHRGVYAVGHAAVPPYGRLLAAVLSHGTGAVASHGSAAWLWGISSVLPKLPEVTATASRHRREDVRVHSSQALNAEDRASVEGVPVTAVPRTLLDLAGHREANLRWALPRAKRLGLLDIVALDEMLRRNHGARGAGRLRLALARYRRPQFTRSTVEIRFLELVEEAGLPQPSTNLFIEGFELDAYWPGLRFAVELDTYDHHGDEESFEADRLRHEDLKLAGIEMIRVTGQRMDREPAAVASRLRRHLAQRRRELNRR
jgi:Transcriptional regulator, AbiEi antitoxin